MSARVLPFRQPRRAECPRDQVLDALDDIIRIEKTVVDRATLEQVTTALEQMKQARVVIERWNEMPRCDGGPTESLRGGNYEMLRTLSTYERTWRARLVELSPPCPVVKLPIRRRRRKAAR